MSQSEQPRDRTNKVPDHMIRMINKVVRVSRQMLPEIGREPTPEEIAARLAVPLEKVHKILTIAKHPVSLKTPLDCEDRHNR